MTEAAEHWTVMHKADYFALPVRRPALAKWFHSRLGYTEQDGYKAMDEAIDAYREAFGVTPLTLDVCPAFYENTAEADGPIINHDNQVRCYRGCAVVCAPMNESCEWVTGEHHWGVVVAGAGGEREVAAE